MAYELGQLVGFVLLVFLTIWVYFDASGKGSTHAGWWAAGTFLLALIVLPCYVFGARKKLLSAHASAQYGAVFHPMNYPTQVGPTMYPPAAYPPAPPQMPMPPAPMSPQQWHPHWQQPLPTPPPPGPYVAPQPPVVSQPPPGMYRGPYMPSPAEAASELDQLLDSGEISRWEYDALKRRHG